MNRMYGIIINSVLIYDDINIYREYIHMDVPHNCDETPEIPRISGSGSVFTQHQGRRVQLVLCER